MDESMRCLDEGCVSCGRIDNMASRNHQKHAFNAVSYTFNGRGERMFRILEQTLGLSYDTINLAADLADLSAECKEGREFAKRCLVPLKLR